jgi:acyl-CoA thioesterase I
VTQELLFALKGAQPAKPLIDVETADQSNAVLRGYEHSKSDLLIRDGIRRMKAIGADVILIDPQFAPKVIAKPEIEDMVDLISSAASEEKVNLFHRFALMRHWYEIDGMPFEAFLSSDRLHMKDWSYSCLAKGRPLSWASRNHKPV